VVEYSGSIAQASLVQLPSNTHTHTHTHTHTKEREKEMYTSFLLGKKLVLFINTIISRYASPQEVFHIIKMRLEKNKIGKSSERL
jgi:hypothetical protein